MRIEDFDRYCRQLLKNDEFESADPSRNGIQVERGSGELTKVAFAVDACMQSFEQTAELGADLLFVHHGIFWGRDFPLTGSHYRRVRFLIEHDIALYAAHLPLDAHPEVGNNSEMARALSLESAEGFGHFKGTLIGVRGIMPQPQDINAVLEDLRITPEECNAILPFGNGENRSVGIISGGSSRDVAQAIDAGLDLYITGEAEHTIYHLAQENRINVIALGHYASETWGVRRMAERVAIETDLETVFIDIPTGL